MVSSLYLDLCRAEHNTADLEDHPLFSYEHAMQPTRTRTRSRESAASPFISFRLCQKQCASRIKNSPDAFAAAVQWSSAYLEALLSPVSKLRPPSTRAKNNKQTNETTKASTPGKLLIVLTGFAEKRNKEKTVVRRRLTSPPPFPRIFVYFVISPLRVASIARGERSHLASSYGTFGFGRVPLFLRGGVLHEARTHARKRTP